jgi:hypothetical protein
MVLLFAWLYACARLGGLCLRYLIGTQGRLQPLGFCGEGVARLKYISVLNDACSRPDASIHPNCCPIHSYLTQTVSSRRFHRHLIFSSSHLYIFPSSAALFTPASLPLVLLQPPVSSYIQCKPALCCAVSWSHSRQPHFSPQRCPHARPITPETQPPAASSTSRHRNP